ncbi:cupin domain-containing protein [Thermovorax subterraneus]|nr:cupin domain-containing protein [Thermovorax subterraneus]
MEIINLEQSAIFSGEKITPNRIIEKEEVQVVLLAFEPGQGVPEHKTPVDVFFYVVEGTVEILIGEEKREIEEGNIVLSPANIPHAIKNNSGEKAMVLVVKTPNPQFIKK